MFGEFTLNVREPQTQSRRWEPRESDAHVWASCLRPRWGQNQAERTHRKGLEGADPGRGTRL